MRLSAELLESGVCVCIVLFKRNSFTCLLACSCCYGATVFGWRLFNFVDMLGFPMDLMVVCII